MTELPELLGQLKDEWGRRGLPVGMLRPGISRDEVESKIKALPFDLKPPEELYEWYAWHDGADSDAQATEAEMVFNGTMPMFPSHFPLASLDVACGNMRITDKIWSASERYRDQGSEDFHAWEEGNEEFQYVESHFCFLRDECGSFGTIACVGGETGRVYARDDEGFTGAPPLDSIAQLVRGFLKVYELGEVNTDNYLNMHDDPSKHTGFETMDGLRVKKRDPLISRFY